MLTILSIRTKLYLSYLYYSFWNRYKLTPTSSRHVYIFLAADYGNLGDVAITQTQHLFLQAKYPSAEIVEVPISETIVRLHGIAKGAAPDDVVTIVGGGNMGDMYDDIEYLRQLVIKAFPRHLVISFPQSIYYSDTIEGKKRMKQARRIYGKHKHLILMARDPVSYHRMQDYFPDLNILLRPDIVLYLDKRKREKRSRNVLFCLRKDREQAIQDVLHIPSLMQYIQKNYEHIQVTDTQIDDSLVKTEGGNKYLGKIWNDFSQSGLVVTDRLHGMIFAFITKTPALVFDNKTQKISATYTWIKDCGFIHLVNENTDFASLNFVDNFDEVKAQLNNLFNQMI